MAATLRGYVRRKGQGSWVAGVPAAVCIAAPCSHSFYIRCAFFVIQCIVLCVKRGTLVVVTVAPALGRFA